jgi:small subunit ribosomal protein S2
MNQKVTMITEERTIFEEMQKAGVQYGRAKKYTHPTMRPFLIKTLYNIEIFNLQLTLQKMHEMANALTDYLKSGKTILFVATTPAASSRVTNFALTFNQPYMNYKWVGGFLTNFSTSLSRLAYFKDLLKKEEAKELEEYPPKERSKLERELNKLKNIYSGVIKLEKLPDALFIVNLAHPSHVTAKREALRLKIPIFALAGSDNDITGVNYFVPCNDKAPRSIAFIMDWLEERVKSKLNS